MKQLRQWEIKANSPYELSLSADYRLCQTSYVDDQSWYLLLGTGDAPALTLQTHYGFRVGLASLVPMWGHENHLIYQAQTYHKAPQITAFTPNYIAIEAEILPSLHLLAEHLALNSQVIGGIYSLRNESKRDIEIRLDIFGHMAAEGKEQKLAIISLAEAGHGLSLGAMPKIAPVVLMDSGTATAISGRGASPKIGADLFVKAGESVQVRFVHAGMADLRQSLNMARDWLGADWTGYLQSIAAASEAIPEIDTGNDEWDLVLASAYNRTVQAVLNATGSFPRETFVAARLPEFGYSKRGDGADYPRMWAGQMPEISYLLAPVLASIDAHAAEGILRNYIALQKEDGFIDLIPNAGGADEELLCLPILARTAWEIYEKTENKDFLADIFSGLEKFFNLWLKQDADGDGFPEWQDERQLRYAAFPSFGHGFDWSQGADISRVESPDLLAYLLSEAEALHKIATELGNKSAVKGIKQEMTRLGKGLDAFWTGTAYAYRDRDTNISTTGMELLHEGAGDAEHVLNRALAVPNRVIVKIVGGVTHIPKITLHISGLGGDGKAISETASAKEIYWANRQGVYTTEAIFSQVDSIRCEGLSRVYKIFASTMDTTALDLNALMPLITAIPKAKAESLAKFALSKKDFLRPNGISMSHSDNHFDPSGAEGSGGLWFYWQTLLGEAIIAQGSGATIAGLVKSQLYMLVSIYRETHQSAQFYHSDAPIPLGDKGHLAGIAPLLLFEKLHGIRILSPSKVLIGKEFAWGKTINIKQHGVTVNRSSKKIKVKFAGEKVQEFSAPLSSDVVVIAEKPIADSVIEPIRLPKTVIEVKAEEAPAKRIIIEVEADE